MTACTQDEEMLNLMLSLASSQSTHLDDDSVLGFNHQTEQQNESIEDETLEMSQLFTGELEEMWSSQAQNSDADRNTTDCNNSPFPLTEQCAVSDENVAIPQLDGAFDEDFQTSKGIILNMNILSHYCENRNKRKLFQFDMNLYMCNYGTRQPKFPYKEVV